MKKGFKIIGITVLILSLILAIFVFLIFESIKPRTIAELKSPDNKYTLSFIETESAIFFGPSEVSLVLRNGDEEKHEINTEICNDGKRLDAYNWRVNWQHDYVEVTLKGEEQDDEVFIIYFVKRVIT